MVMSSGHSWAMAGSSIIRDERIQETFYGDRRRWLVAGIDATRTGHHGKRCRCVVSRGDRFTTEWESPRNSTRSNEANLMIPCTLASCPVASDAVLGHAYAPASCRSLLVRNGTACVRACVRASLPVPVNAVNDLETGERGARIFDLF